MSQLEYMDVSRARFRTTAGGLVSLQFDDTFYPKVDVYLSFPFSYPEQFISIRDEEGEEIGLIYDLSELDSVSREAVQQELKWRYFTPKIERITSYKEEFGHTYWGVITERGRENFVTRGRDQAIRIVSETRILIIDVSGNRFEIPDLRKLDARSRQYVETLL
ncbi:MAG: DUF1854 domain-containing protein [Firmicutes bacterium]|nr:DUF1854 domain-containing protein [Bacillota bacterium]